jgi:hypothetical protein
MSKEEIKKYNPNKPNGGFSESQLAERVRGKIIAQEFNFPNDILQNQRERSLQTGELHGCECFVDGDINLYVRGDFVKYIQAREWTKNKIIEKPNKKPSDTSDNSTQKPKLKVVSK